MKTTINLATSNGYIFRNEKLMAYEFISAIVDFSSGHVQYKCMLGGMETSFVTDECPIVYKNEDAYREGNGHEGSEHNWAQTLCQCFNVSTHGSKCNDTGVFMMWTIENNVAVEAQAPMSNYIFKRSKYSYVSPSYVGGGVYYGTRREAELYCDLTTVDENGIEHVSKSAYHKLKLNDMQARALENVKKSFKEAEALGVEFIYDTETCDVYAFSKNCVENYYFDYRDSHAEVDHVDLLEESGISIMDCNTCDCGFYIKWK